MPHEMQKVQTNIPQDCKTDNKQLSKSYFVLYIWRTTFYCTVLKGSKIVNEKDTLINYKAAIEHSQKKDNGLNNQKLCSLKRPG